MRADIYFSQIPDWITDSDISDGAYRLFGVLCTYASRDTRKCHPARSTLAQRIGKTDRMVDKYLKELVGIGCIETIPRMSEDNPKVQTSNEYTLRLIPPDIRVAKYFTPPSETDYAGGGETGYAQVAKQVSHKQEPMNKNQLNKNNTSSRKRDGGYTEEFEAFWKTYPRKNAKQAAFKSWKKLTDSEKQLAVEGAWRYANDPNRVDQFTAHGSTWLNEKRWEDAPLPARSGNQQTYEQKVAYMVNSLNQQQPQPTYYGEIA